MEFKGTKGKWSYEVTKKGHCRLSGNDWSNFCKVYTITSGADWKKVTQANAQLISCAPEMLEMLQYFVKENMLSITGEEMAIELIKKATEI